jgi:hypothetical protein
LDRPTTQSPLLIDEIRARRVDVCADALKILGQAGEAVGA